MSPFKRKSRYCRPFKGATFYKPRAVAMSCLEVIDLDLDELEAMHLCDFEELSQGESAKEMNISSSTLQRILYSGRKKIVDALYTKKAIKIFTPDNITIKKVNQ